MLQICGMLQALLHEKTPVTSGGVGQMQNLAQPRKLNLTEPGT